MSKFSILQLLIEDRDIINNILDYDSEWKDCKENVIAEMNKNYTTAKHLYKIRNPDDKLEFARLNASNVMYYLRINNHKNYYQIVNMPTINTHKWNWYLSKADNIIIECDIKKWWSSTGEYLSYQYYYSKDITYKYLNLPPTPDGINLSKALFKKKINILD